MKAKHYGEIVNKIRQDRNMTLKKLLEILLLPTTLVALKKD